MKLRTIINIWHDLNATVFNGQLSVPRFFNTRSRDHYAAFTYDDSQAYMYYNTKIIKGDIAKSIVYHEATHQYGDEVLHLPENEQLNHGPMFWDVYRRLRPADVILFSELK